MNKCPKCGTKLIGSAKFCPMCVKKWKEIKSVTIPTKEIQEKGEIQMNKCPKCGTEFEGKFCPECGSSPTGERLCPNCKALVPSDAKFCKECGFTLTPQIQPPVRKQRNNAAAVWIKAHKKLIGWGAAALALVLILSIVIPVSVINRHNGTYYLYSNEEYNYEKYFIFKGNTYTDETGYSCDVKFHGENVELYGELFGMKDVFMSGTINGDVLKLEDPSGKKMVYAKKGHKHNLKDGVIREATCTETGLREKYCTVCGQDFSEIIEKIPHTVLWDFDKTRHWQICSVCGQKITSEETAHQYSTEKQCDICGYEYGSTIGLTYSVGKESCTVTGLGIATDTEIVIPNQYNGKPVISIGSKAFMNFSGLISVIIPNSVTEIGVDAFWGCTKLTSVSIPNSVNEIGQRAFEGCSGLTKIKVDENNETYHSQGNCLIETKSKTLILGCNTSKIPDDGSVTAIGKRAFYKCSGLTSVTIPDSVTSIGNYAFDGCDGLKEVHFKNPNGWKADLIPLSGLYDPATAAQYLTNTYVGYYWKREG